MLLHLKQIQENEYKIQQVNIFSVFLRTPLKKFQGFAQVDLNKFFKSFFMNLSECYVGVSLVTHQRIPYYFSQSFSLELVRLSKKKSYSRKSNFFKKFPGNCSISSRLQQRLIRIFHVRFFLRISQTFLNFLCRCFLQSYFKFIWKFFQ